MKNEVFKYLKKYCSKKSDKADRFIISAFLAKNNIEVAHNLLIRRYHINQSNKREYKQFREFYDIINREIKVFDVEELVELFEFVISPADKIITGAIYTPGHIREYIVEKTLFRDAQIDDITIADIACGCGGFLYTSALAIRRQTGRTFAEIYEKQLFGLDIKEYSINRTKILLSLLALSEGEDKRNFKFNLFVGDALEFQWNGKIRNFIGFHAVIGNPPYVCSRHLSAKTKKLLSNWHTSQIGHPDLYIPFFEIGLENLRDTGTLGFITMNSFFKSLNGRAIREYFKRKSYYMEILDFGTDQVFRSRNTYTCICLITKMTAAAVNYLRWRDTQTMPNHNIPVETIPYVILDSKKGWNLINPGVINQIESVGTPFGEKYKTRNGIATLKNDIYIFAPIDEDRNFYYLQNGSVYPIEKGICQNIINPNGLTEARTIDSMIEKVIFPYTRVEGQRKPSVLTETYIRENFPRAHRYLNHKRETLAKRDKGKGKYEKWFAYGRNQSLEKMRYKLFFPHLANETPSFLLNDDENLLFYNGLAIVSESDRELLVIKKILESRVFWYYIQNTSKPYGSGYYSLSGNYIRNFGVCDLTPEETNFVLLEHDRQILDTFFEDKYQVRL